MKLRCVKCGSIVSSELPDDCKISAWVECRNCVNKEVFSDRVIFDRYTLPQIKVKADALFLHFRRKNMNVENMLQIFKDSCEKAKKCSHVTESQRRSRFQGDAEMKFLQQMHPNHSTASSETIQ